MFPSLEQWFANLHKERFTRFVPRFVKSIIFRLTFLPTMLGMLLREHYDVRFSLFLDNSAKRTVCSL